MSKTTEKYKQDIIDAGYIAVDELVKVLRFPIIEEHDKEGDGNGEQSPEQKADISSDKMRNAVAAKKMACFDAFEILQRIDAEQISLGLDPDKKDTGYGFAESRSK